MGKSKIITYVVVAILVLIGLYWVYQLINKKPETITAGVVVANLGSNPADINDQTSQFVNILKEIDSIDLQNHSILSDKNFMSLKDFGRTIEERAIGRANPFSPLTGGTGLVSGAGTGSPTNQ